MVVVGSHTKENTNCDLCLVLKTSNTATKNIKQIIETYGECSREDIIRELEDHEITNINSKKLTNALRELKRKSKIHSRVRNRFRSVSTIGVVPIFNKPKDEKGLLKWYSQIVYYHNVKGIIYDAKFDTKQWTKKKESKQFHLKNHKGYVRLIRNHDTIQFVFACKRPGFLLSGLMECIAILYEQLIKHRILGEPIVKYLEPRNSRRIVIQELIGQTYTLEMFSGLVAKAYQDKEELQTEFQAQVDYSLADLVNCAVHLRGSMNEQLAHKTLEDSVKRTRTEIDVLSRTTRAHTVRTNDLMYEITEKMGEASASVEYVDSRLYEISQNMFEIKNNQVIDDLKEAFDLMISRVHTLELKLEEDRKEKAEFRKLSLEQQKGIVEQYRELGLSFDTIAERLFESPSTIYGFAVKEGVHTKLEGTHSLEGKNTHKISEGTHKTFPENFEIFELIEKSFSLERKKVLELFNENEVLSKSQIYELSGVKRAKRTVLQIIDYLVSTGKLIESNDPSHSQRKLYRRNNNDR